jgi:hypothetical protein
MVYFPFLLLVSLKDTGLFKANVVTLNCSVNNLSRYNTKWQSPKWQRWMASGFAFEARRLCWWLLSSLACAYAMCDPATSLLEIKKKKLVHMPTKKYRICIIHHNPEKQPTVCQFHGSTNKAPLVQENTVDQWEQLLQAMKKMKSSQTQY